MPRTSKKATEEKSVEELSEEHAAQVDAEREKLWAEREARKQELIDIEYQWRKENDPSFYVAEDAAE